MNRQIFRIPLCCLFIIVSSCSWNTSLKDIKLLQESSSDKIRSTIQKNDQIISKYFGRKKITPKLRKAIHSNVRLYSALAMSPSFDFEQIRLSNSGETSFFNPTFGYVYIYKDDLRYFNIHGVLIHETVGHPIDPDVYPIKRFFNTIRIFNPVPLILLELRAIASVPMVWKNLHNHIKRPYKPWNILHPVAGSLDCKDVFEWFYKDKRTNWKNVKNLKELNQLVKKFPTDSLPHLLARIYLLILSVELSEQELWKYVQHNNITKVEKRVERIIKEQENIASALQKGLYKKYRNYLNLTKLNTITITQLLSKSTPYAKKQKLKIYSKNIGTKGIIWYDHFPFGISHNDHITWIFSDIDSFEDQGADGPNHENVLDNIDCAAEHYDEIWEKCALLSEFFMRYSESKY
ncbi:hypothetical protein [Candidatus Uabimicrobium sp. HlEnr_7]|uniref:hypothetical protein n=1 Tax=Candidatus Uabimicrobium helgolandensis TaxID=3095367 RepID=UPI003556454E